MTPPKTIAGFHTPELRLLMNAEARAGVELSVDVVDCPACGAKAGYYCWGAHGKRCKTPHVDRRDSAQRWKKEHPKEWVRLKDATFRRILSQTH